MPVKKTTEIRLPADLVKVVEETADALGLPLETVFSQLVFDAFRDKMLQRGIKPPMPPKHKEVHK